MKVTIYLFLHVLCLKYSLKLQHALFLFMQIHVKANELDESGDIALDLALSSHQESVAKLLLDHKANVNQIDNRGWTLLHKAIDRSKI